MNRTDILAEAARLTATERQATYGEPHENHERIALLWSVFLGTQVSAAQASMCLALVKVARLAHAPNHLDSFIDLAAYAAIAGEIATEETCPAPSADSLTSTSTTATGHSSRSS